MKKTIVLALLASFVFLTGFSNSKPAPVKNQDIKLFSGWMTGNASDGNTVYVYVTWNTLNSVGHRVSAVSVVDPNGFSIYTMSSWEQDPRILLVSGGLVAYGFRCDFHNQNGGSYHVILNGNFNMN